MVPAMPRRGQRLLTGDRAYLRRPSPADREEFLLCTRASTGLHVPWVSPPATEQDFDEYLRRNRRANQAGFLVCRTDDHAIAGVVNVNEIVRGWFQSGYLGYYAFESHAGQGYMAEGLRLVLRYAFETLRLHRLEANVQPGNAASVALVQRVGLRQEGLSPRYLYIDGAWRDHERWAITIEDWQAPSG
jgi:ribosomal-protein-alanine N-acetyltransferase